MANSIRALEGTHFATAALRTVTTDDTGTPDLTAAGFKATPRVKCLGAGALYAMAGHDAGAGSVDVVLALYNKEDNLIAVTDPTTLDATARTGTLTEDDESTTNSRFLAAASVELPVAAYAARVFVASITTSTEIDLFLALDDGFTR